MKKSVLLLFAVLLLSSFAVHKFYVSVTQVDYVPSKKRMEITSRIFLDDFEKALNKRFNTKVNLTSARELPEAEELIKTYLKEKIKISINKKPQGIALVKLPDGASAASFTAKARGSQQVKVHFTKMPAFHASPVLGKKLIK